MKLITAFICLVLLSNTGFARTGKRFGHKYPKNETEIKTNSIVKWSADNFNIQARLKEIKYNIINGNLENAKLLIARTESSIEFSEKIKLRYLAIINFIEGNYEQTIRVLDRPIMNNFLDISKFCFMKILSLIILEKKKQAKNEWFDCKQASLPFSENSLTWMQTIVDLKTTTDKDYIENFFKTVKIDNYKGESLRIFLKLALYLNQQDKIIPRFKFFGRDPLENEIERELIALNYYRNGNLVKAYQLLEDLSTANSEVFKGNLYLHQKRLEPAYAQFKVALKRKSNSENALERLIPLSWRLNAYDEGLDFLNMLSRTSSKFVEHETLKAAFAIMAKKYEMAFIALRKISKKTNFSQPVEISQLQVIDQITRKNYEKITDASISACQGKDGINCWFLIALNTWPSLIENLEKNEKIHSEENNLTQKYINETNINPIDEEKLLEQDYIEELDNNLINL